MTDRLFTVVKVSIFSAALSMAVGVTNLIAAPGEHLGNYCWKGHLTEAYSANRSWIGDGFVAVEREVFNFVDHEFHIKLAISHLSANGMNIYSLDGWMVYEGEPGHLAPFSGKAYDRDGKIFFIRENRNYDGLINSYPNEVEHDPSLMRSISLDRFSWTTDGSLDGEVSQNINHAWSKQYHRPTGSLVTGDHQLAIDLPLTAEYVQLYGPRGPIELVPCSAFPDS